jgi:5'-nucleotidase
MMERTTGRVVAAILAALTALLLSAAPAAAVGNDSFVLTILHNNDGESKLVNAGTGLESYGGIARFATVVDRLRAEGRARQPGDGGAHVKRGAILLSSGDNFLAGPQFNASLEKGVPFYDSIALSLIRYDAMALGNHEFDFGPDVLADFIRGFGGGLPVFLSANLDFSAEPSLARLERKGRIAASTVIREKGQRVGIVGATTPLLPAISSPRNVVVDPDVAGAIQAEIDKLEAAGVNKVILISHLQNVQEDLALAPFLSGLDVMIAGGGDELLANPGDLLVPGDVVNGAYPLTTTNAEGDTVPVITTAGDYKYVGRLVVEFSPGGDVVGWDGEKSGPVRVSSVPPDAVEPNPAIQQLVVEPVEAAVAALAANVIATSEVALEGRRGPTPPGVRTAETNLGNLMADSLLWQGRELAATFGVPAPDVALQNGGGIRNNTLIPAGNFTELDTFSIAAFANFVSVVPSVPRDQFKEILENAVSRVPLADGRFAQVAGFSFVYDPAGTAQVVDNAGTVLTPGTRVQHVELDDGTVIVDDGGVVPGPGVTVATNDFSARGGDQYPFRGLPFTTIGVTYQQALRNYVEQLPGTPLPVISAAQYPEGGEGRITTCSPSPCP